MNNTLTVVQLSTPDDCVVTEIETFDGFKATEVHRKGLHDSRVLKEMFERNYYQHIRGDWTIFFPATDKTIQRKTFKEAVSTAEDYIFIRDNI